MHLINKIGVDRVIDNTRRVERMLARSVRNPLPSDIDLLMREMMDKYHADFVEKMFRVISRLTGYEIETRRGLYDILRSEPFICVVVVVNGNGSNYPENVPLLVTQYGVDRLQMPDGTYGNIVPPSIRLATNDEMLGLAKMVGID